MFKPHVLRFRLGAYPPGFWHGPCPCNPRTTLSPANSMPDRPLQEAYRVIPCKPRALLLARNVRNANPVPRFSLQTPCRVAAGEQARCLPKRLARFVQNATLVPRYFKQGPYQAGLVGPIGPEARGVQNASSRPEGAGPVGPSWACVQAGFSPKRTVFSVPGPFWPVPPFPTQERKKTGPTRPRRTTPRPEQGSCLVRYLQETYRGSRTGPVSWSGRSIRPDRTTNKPATHNRLYLTL